VETVSTRSGHPSNRGPGSAATIAAPWGTLPAGSAHLGGMTRAARTIPSVYDVLDRQVRRPVIPCVAVAAWSDSARSRGEVTLSGVFAAISRGRNGVLARSTGTARERASDRIRVEKRQIGWCT